jgi:hypothetical protein
MQTREIRGIANTFALGLALTLAPAARAMAAAPTAPAATSDEARVAIERSEPVVCPEEPTAHQPSSTDDARTLDAETLDAAPSAPSDRTPATVSSSDDARATAAAAIDERPELQACAGQAPGHAA